MSVRRLVVNPNTAAKPLRGDQVGLLELQPGDVADLDHGILRATSVFSGQAALLGVQIAVGVVLAHVASYF